MPQMRAYPQATSTELTDAYWLDRIGVGSMYITGADLQKGALYAPSFEFFGAPPAASELMGGLVFPVAVNFAVNFAGSSGHCEINPAASFTALIYQISAGVASEIGEMTISTSGVFSFTAAASVTFAAGDSIKVVGPATPDVSLQNLWWTFLGSMA